MRADARVQSMDLVSAWSCVPQSALAVAGAVERFRLVWPEAPVLSMAAATGETDGTMAAVDTMAEEADKLEAAVGKQAVASRMEHSSRRVFVPRAQGVRLVPMASPQMYLRMQKPPHPQTIL